MQAKFGKKFNFRMVNKKQLTEIELDRIIEMAWEDRTPFEAILFQFGCTEKDVIKLMRGNLKESNFKYKPQKRGFAQASFLYKLGLVILQSLRFLS